MMKRVISLILCLVMIGTVFAGCSSGPDENKKGAYIDIYLTDMVYDLDPAHAFTNESLLKIVPLLFDNLFVLKENGKIEKSLAKDYKIVKNEQANEYKMIITLGDGKWSDNIDVTANDVVYAWKRILDNENDFTAASLLYDIKNARAAKHGDASIDDVAIYALNEKEVSIEFEGDIDYDQFLLNLTSYALVPLREEVVIRNGEDWAKKPATIVTSGPFKLRVATYDTQYNDDDTVKALKEFVLERNVYYYRDPVEDAYDKTVKPYRLVINYGMTDEEIMKAYEDGKIFYVGDIPLSARKDYADSADISDALSTHTYILNHNAVVRKYNATGFKELSSSTSVYDDTLVEGVDGEKIFAKAEVREALSLAIDRNAIKEAVVFAEVATGLVPNGIYNADSKKESFREIGGNLIADKADINAAKALLSTAGVNASDYMFAISVASYDDVHMCIANMVKEAWEELGFHVAVNAIDVMTNDDFFAPTETYPKDIKDDIFAEDYRAGRFEVAAIDLCALSPDAFSMLSVYAKEFSGEGMDMTKLDYELTPHISGYDDKDYNALIEKAFDEKDIEKRADILHDAEEMLIEDMVIIPIIFNKNATLTSKDLSKITYTYYGNPNFTKAKLKNYEDYLPEEE